MLRITVLSSAKAPQALKDGIVGQTAMDANDSDVDADAHCKSHGRAYYRPGVRIRG